MNIVCLLGSPRKKGNSARVARHFLESAAAVGAEVESIYLNGLNLKGCQACNRCKTDAQTCVIEDDLTDVLDRVAAADVVVMASPVYYGDVSAQLKTFVDRSFCYLRPGYIRLDHPSRFDRPKELVFILTQGHRDPQWFADIVPRYEEIFRWTGFARMHPVRVVDVYHPGDVDRRDDILTQVDALAQRLLSPSN